VFVTLREVTRQPVADFEAAVSQIPQIVEAQRLFGDPDYLLHVVAKDLPAFQKLYDEQLTSIPNVKRLSSTLVMKEVIQDRLLPMYLQHRLASPTFHAPNTCRGSGLARERPACNTPAPRQRALRTTSPPKTLAPRRRLPRPSATWHPPCYRPRLTFASLSFFKVHEHKFTNFPFPPRRHHRSNKNASPLVGTRPATSDAPSLPWSQS
jgi:hypothetical protein